MHTPAPAGDRPLWKNRWWWVLFLAAVLFRIWSVAALASDPRVAEPILDGKHYLELAQRLADGKGWPAGPIFMTPSYPWLLGMLFRLTPAASLTVQIFQAVLGLVTFIVLTVTVRRDLGGRVALALGALYALCGPLLGIESQVLTESLLLFLTAVALFLWPKPGQPWWRHLLFGVVAGLLATGRGIFLLVPLAALVHFWIAQRSAEPPAAGLPSEKSKKRHRSRVKRSNAVTSAPGMGAGPAASVLSLLAGLVLALLPLAIHQTRSVGSLRILSLNGGMNFYVGNHSAAVGMYSLPPEIDLETDFTATHAASRLEGRPVALAESYQFWTERALHDLMNDPGRWLSLWTRKALLFLSPRDIPQIEDFQILRERHLPLRFALFDFAWILPLAVLGLVAHVRSRLRSRAKSAEATPSTPPDCGTNALTPWLIVIGIGWLSTILFFATGRYRIPFLAGFLGPAALGLALLVETAQKRRLRVSLIVLPLTVAIQLVLPGYPLNKARAYDYNQAGLRLRRNGNGSAALEEYRKAAATDPEDGLAWHGIGVCLVHLDRLPEAAEAYGQALARIPQSALTHYNLGIVQGRMGKDDLALGELKEANRLDPFDLRIRSDMAVALGRTGNEAESLRIVQEVLKENPRFPPAVRLLRALEEKKQNSSGNTPPRAVEHP